MGATPLFGLPYPEYPDVPDLRVINKALADKVEASLNSPLMSVKWSGTGSFPPNTWTTFQVNVLGANVGTAGWLTFDGAGGVVVAKKCFAVVQFSIQLASPVDFKLSCAPDHLNRDRWVWDGTARAASGTLVTANNAGDRLMPAINPAVSANVVYGNIAVRVLGPWP